MRHYKITYIGGDEHKEDVGKSIVHVGSVLSGDSSLCGHDLAGDETMGWSMGEPTKDKVTCEDCIRVVDYARKIKESEIDRKK